MKTFYKCLFVLMGMLCIAGGRLKAQSFPAGFQATQLATGLNPTDMKFSPDGQYLFITDKTGKVFVVENDLLRTSPLLDLASVIFTDGEKGLTHVCIDPDFSTNHYVYLYFTVRGSRTISAANRISRFTFDPATYTLGNEFVLTTLQDMVGPIHTGGAMNFGKDGKLYVTTGESSHPILAQDFQSQLGKILRMNKDGSIPTDNPFYNDLTGNLRYIYALGLRNPYAADIHPVTGRYLVCDVGQNTYEEINDIKPKGNYGWLTIEGPIQSGTTPPDNYQNPILYYDHDEGCAIVGGVFYAPANPSFPAEYVNKFFYGDYCNATIKVMDPDSYQVMGTFGSGLKRPVAFAVKPSGEFYYLDRGGTPHSGEEDVDGILWKVTYTGSLAPVIGAQPQTTIVSVGGTASFSVLANGLGLTYEWMKDGTPIPDSDSSSVVLPNVVLTDSGALITCKVTNGFGQAISQPAVLRVTSRLPPVPLINLPVAGITYVANSTMQYSGMATDDVDGLLPANKLTWKIDFHHDTHYHPGLDATPGNVASGSYFLPGNIEVSDTVWYRIYLTAENSLGLKATVYREVYPEKVTLRIRSMVNGRLAAIPINLDGTISEPQTDKLSVKGVSRSINAQATYTVNDTLFTFVGWGNGNTYPALNIVTPNADTTITALYHKSFVFAGEGLKGEYRTNSTSFTGPVTLTRIDPAINFSWPESPGPGMSQNNFTVVWEGYVQPRTSGAYTIYLDNNKSHAELFFNDAMLIDRNPGGSIGGDKAVVNLTAGSKYKVRIQYWAGYYDTSTINLQWSGPRVFKQVIPVTSMYTLESALPVIFSEFTVRPVNAQLQLNWKVEQESHVKGYAVERRRSGAGAFETIAFFDATGTDRYQYADKEVQANTLYQYRIREDDLDGRSTYSAIRNGRLSGGVDFDYIIVPNPVDVNRQVQLVFTQAVGVAEVQLITPDGKVLQQQRMTAAGQTMSLPLKGVAAGTYYLKVIQGGQVVVKKLLVQ
ncbi:PQQ-dependent sugar dehydrogenase [Paraflavitalea sp. CAU 1676]|uniref:PQQ-dependent sugar dehydrogenase n=1 Tax=Paraflavitalea sp. CAU 1676 TaxID=3032598 RepID=UPI0023D9ABBC|nr:PQQ-dependent sugar dehydrogenase [Paraflavitalea sp. CAU 1676]MDF2193686.1 PQQ-dependent sugar dehydrogenase [Paraflavitalea sp. CAU 1676]